MTCIVGLVHKGRVWMGGDSFCECGNVSYIRAEPKVFARHEPDSERRVLIGAAGDQILSQLAQLNLVLPPRRADWDPGQYIAQGVCGALIEAIEAHLQAVRQKKWPNGRILFGYEGQLFSADRNFSVLHEDSGLMVIGWGDEVGIGALEATPELEPEERIRRALAIAAKRTTKVAPPFRIESL